MRRGNTSTIIWWHNEAPPKIEKQNMKTRNLLITTGAAVLAAITINASAYDIVLSPHAAANQIKTVPDTTVVQAAPATGIALSPHAAANQIKTVPGTTVVQATPATGIALSPRDAGNRN